MPSTRGARAIVVLVALGVATAAGVTAQRPATALTEGVPTEGVVTVAGLRIHYVDWGGAGKPAMVLIHGIDRIARTFDHIAPHFADRYRVIAYDLRGHGDSGWDPQGRYLVEDHLSDLEGLVRQLGLRDLVLWGNSTGGRVAQVFAGQHPDLVRYVISEDVGPERPRAIADNYARRVQQEAAGWATEDELLAALRKQYQGSDDAVLRPYLRYGARRTPEGRLVWKRDPNLVKGFVATELWRYVRQIRSPILYVIGGRSNIVPPETQQELRTTLPNAQIVTMPGLGHYPSDEKPAVN